MNIMAGSVLCIAFIFEILLGVWLFFVPAFSQLLWGAMIFILGVIMPSPVFAPLINRAPRTGDQQAQYLDNYQRAVNIENGTTTVTHQPTSVATPVGPSGGGGGGGGGSGGVIVPPNTGGGGGGAGDMVITPLPHAGNAVTV